LTGAQRLLLLDTWRRSGLPADDFAPLVGISKHTLYAWKHKFETEGPAGLEEKPRGGPTGSRLPKENQKKEPRISTDETRIKMQGKCLSTF
jgi:transposase